MFLVQFTQLKTGEDRAFQKAVPTPWNNLPLNISALTSLHPFRKANKIHLLWQEHECACMYIINALLVLTLLDKVYTR